MSLNGVEKEDEDKELNLALQILKFQCDYNLEGKFNKKLKEIDNKLSSLGSNRRASDILNDLLTKLPGVIGTIKFLEISNEQEKIKKPTVQKINKVKSEPIEITESSGQECIIRKDTPNLIESPWTSKNQELPHQVQPKRKTSKKSSQKFTSPPKNNQQQNSSLTQNTLKNAKTEHFVYSSSENESEESGEESEEDGTQQQSSSSSCKKQMPKLEKIVDEEIVVEIPETPNMTLDEIEKLAAENAKRNKRIRYFSTDSEEEDNHKKKKRVNKSPKKKQPVKNGQGTSSQTKNTDSLIQPISNDQISVNSPKLPGPSQNLLDLNDLDPKIGDNKNSKPTSEECKNEQPKLTPSIESFLEGTKHMNIAQFDKEDLHRHFLNLIQNHPRSSQNLSEPTQKKEGKRLPIKRGLEILSAITVKQIETDRIKIEENKNDEELTKKLKETCDKHTKLLMQIKIDRFLILVADEYWFRTAGQHAKGNKRSKVIRNKMDRRIHGFKISNSIDLRKALAGILAEIFGDHATDVDRMFHYVVFHIMQEDGCFKSMYGCETTEEILNETKFMEIVKDLTSDRMVFLNFLEQKFDCNYEISFKI